MSRGGSMAMSAKGNRSAQVTEAGRKHGGFYLGSIEVVEYPPSGRSRTPFVSLWKARGSRVA
jgi:hypothetical protein